VVVELLDSHRIAELRAARLTYPEVGRTSSDPPPGYRTFRRTTTLPATIDFDTAAQDLFHWQVQRRAGLRAAASSETIAPGAVVVLRFGWLPVRAPCRVIYVVNELRCRGFAYGTLPGHPETGEEAFILDLRDDGEATFTICAFSRPATAVAKLVGPLGRAAQDLMTRRYLRTFAS
jgi:uncharacterized protein (UPF0548 family)